MFGILFICFLLLEKMSDKQKQPASAVPVTSVKGVSSSGATTSSRPSSAKSATANELLASSEDEPVFSRAAAATSTTAVSSSSLLPSSSRETKMVVEQVPKWSTRHPDIPVLRDITVLSVRALVDSLRKHHLSCERDGVITNTLHMCLYVPTLALCQSFLCSFCYNYYALF